MNVATDSDIRELLMRHGIASLGVDGSGSAAASSGGTIATIRVARQDTQAHISVTIDDVHASRPCPLEPSNAVSLVQSFHGSALATRDESFDRMLEHLLMKISAMYVDSGAESLNFNAVHLHKSAYHVGSVRLESIAPLNVKPRREHDPHQRHAP
jgi:hypothetical protein